MKKLALTIVCASAITGVAFAQGNVNWGAISFSYMTAQTNSTQYSPLFSGSGTPVGGAIGGTATTPAGFYYELLYKAYDGNQAPVPNTLSDLMTWSDAGLSGNNSTLLASWLQPINANTAASVPWAVGTTSSIVLVGWSANLGTDWTTVSGLLNNGTYDGVLAGQNGFFGISNTGYVNPGSSNPGSAVFGGATAQGLGITSLNTQLYLLPTAVGPEPATLALAGLGGLSLLLFRRRKS
jgi:hypothetical protein